MNDASPSQVPRAAPSQGAAEGARLIAGDVHDEALRAAVHPADWVNPQPAPRYNLVVLGAGTAGLVAAAGAAGLGARVALVERHLMGGDCLNVGCVPSKGLIAAARRAADVRDAASFGVRVPDGVTVDFGAVMERMRRLRAAIGPHDGAARFRDLGVDVFLGAGTFSGPDRLQVGQQTLRFRKALVATGARAAAPPIPGLETTPHLTNETLFTLTELPRRLLVVGAGPIGCEMAQCFARFGSRVTLVEMGPQVLPREERRAAELVQASLLRDGVDLRLSTATARVREGQDVRVASLRTDAGTEELEFDALLVAVGRAPNVQGLGLEAAAVRFDERAGVVVDDHLRTTNPDIYAAGDVAGRFQFTHTADFQARLVLQNALFPGPRGKASALIVPWCTYTDPELAHVGHDEASARAAGHDPEAFEVDLASVDRAQLDGETEGYVRILVQRGKGTILGATVVARHAGDLISEITVAMKAGLGLSGLASVIHPYPTQAEAVRRVGDVFNRTRLTPFVKGLLSRWLAFTR